MLTTLGTGIGTAVINEGQLVPNTEFGHLQMYDKSAEKYAASSVKDKKGLSYPEWAERLQEYYSYLESLLSPDVIIVGGRNVFPEDIERADVIVLNTCVADVRIARTPLSVRPVSPSERTWRRNAFSSSGLANTVVTPASYARCSVPLPSSSESRSRGM